MERGRATGLVADTAVMQHDPGLGHPEQPSRFAAVLQSLEASDFFADLERIAARVADDDELRLVHTRDYIATVEREVAAGRSKLSTGDTALNRHSALAARLAAGSALAAVDAVFTGAVRNAFCLVRPPGHHASADRGMGFCLFNTVALAARYAQSRWGAERILIVDWDVHHGNGTQDIFYDDGSVLFFSTHQSPWYPGTGARSERGRGSGASFTLNHPLPAGSGRAEIFEAFEQSLFPAAEKFRPDLVLISAGFDSRMDDPLGHFLLTDKDFADLTRLLSGFAAAACHGRLVSVLEGGYNLPGLAAAATAHVGALLA